MISLPIFTHPSMLAHAPGAGHPESPARLKAVLDALDDAGLAADRRAATPAEVADLERVHPAAYVARLLDASPVEGLRALDADTVLSPGSVPAARLAAGAAIDAVRAVARGETARAISRTQTRTKTDSPSMKCQVFRPSRMSLPRGKFSRSKMQE